MINRLIITSALSIADDCRGSYFRAFVALIVWYILFIVVEVAVEKLVFGYRFEHFLDCIFVGMFAVYGVIVMHCCNVLNRYRGVVA